MRSPAALVLGLVFAASQCQARISPHRQPPLHHRRHHHKRLNPAGVELLNVGGGSILPTVTSTVTVFAPASTGAQVAAIESPIALNNNKNRNATLTSAKKSKKKAKGKGKAKSASKTKASSATRTATSTSTSTSTTRPGGGNATSTSDFKLLENYAGDNFFEGWDFFTGGDPTHGDVDFLDADAAKEAGLAVVQDDGTVKLAVDSKSNDVGNARKSVRLSSQATFNQGQLLLFDATHAPVGCGTWPAFWTVGADWPSGGEIDIMEGVNNQDSNRYTLHTGSGCSIADGARMKGEVVGGNCDVAATGNAGCGIKDPRPTSYGRGFNGNNGGVFATLWDDQGIRIWFFPRDEIPSDIDSGSPEPDSDAWGEPTAVFGQSACDTNQFFGEQHVIFDITLNGDWAGATFNSDGCDGSPEDNLQKGANFKEAFFSVNYVKIFQGPNGGGDPGTGGSGSRTGGKKGENNDN